MRRPISFTYIIIVTICSLMNIIALMPATKAYEVLLRNWGGQDTDTCCVWQEDYLHNFITYIPPNAEHNNLFYCFSCGTFDGIGEHGADLRNGILTYHTLDNTTTYWVDMHVINDGPSSNKGGYNKDTCFHVFGDLGEATLDEAPYDECEKIRDSK
ncbi:hypothetical protein RhiirA5_470039 [Rhizophagus irregularis]|uniref:Uncharacterized protein n=5 Tax=Rhizophagus irregularis TaxID=588596 RepID=A0A2I1E199_9GLOM|nr:hypothetical protein GLOIN_2v1483573 [Rhizophagus irregularis DAOM 181602=DAOM 197198]EXX61681.1 hypothetical protein RirG_168920 [Rhizophagus irregularis DAOM 197198w]PKB96818.1 hypothetical protein RhiirA5_470039 [Rhizophagus irregularis]PKY15900.1 hypothetical protein RhiirB3_520775 [Rhizophagus irregularis]POG64805.1 hypothetical protein GLOIN_2v1483573 [Rhizophagus irregularis DAOM 181602=DAOM 197198]UZO11934.1 hypothetical protein OCT59_003487 [Rhizophagus irregularis]|eukprot:XP_025171671.1 hypothetical protein GLOIN_2v1483573 [Rhizophagus irregularis DAOM 181602=DAOM 197198]